MGRLKRPCTVIAVFLRLPAPPDTSFAGELAGGLFLTYGKRASQSGNQA